MPGGRANAPGVPKPDTRSETPAHALVLERLSRAGRVALPVVGLGVVLDLVRGPLAVSGTLLSGALAMALALVAIVSPRVAALRARSVTLAVLCVLGLGVAIAVRGMLDGGVASVPILMASLGLVAALYLPWGVGPQGILAGGLFGLTMGALLTTPGAAPVASAGGFGTFFGLALVLGQSPLIAWTVRERIERAAEAAAAREQLSASLQHRLEEANRLLERRGLALESALEEAEKANISKSRFLAGISHELRTPLTSILGFAAMLRNGAAGPVNAKQFDYASEICTSAEHLLRLLEGILAHARIEANEDPLQLSDVPIDLLVEVACRQVSPAALERQLRMHRSMPTGAHLVADRQKLLQVMLNLLSNAIKFTEPGGEIGTAIADLGDDVEITVWDRGLGLRPEDLERIFRPFEQVPEANRTSQKGFGLGLAISRRLIERHGGSIRAESTPGEGSRFVVRLPKSGPRAALPAAHALAG